MIPTEFLTARYDEREAAARAASPGGWTYGGIESIGGSTLYDETRSIACLDYDQDDAERAVCRPIFEPEADANGAHIVLNDPAYVLADIAAKRAIVALHPCDDCGMGNDPCTTLRLLAQPYAEHTDFDERWRS